VVTLCGWEGNPRSGVTLAMCHKLGGPSKNGLNGHRNEDEHSTKQVKAQFTFLII